MAAPIYDPITDEKTMYSLEEFVEIMKALTTDYGKFCEKNEWQKQGHTFDEWFASFVRWKSW